MTHPLRSRALLTAVCAATVLSAGCQEEPQPLFDEDRGAWVLNLVRLEDGDEIGDLGSDMRLDKFMLNYDKVNQLVAAASCNDSMSNQSVTQSLCDLSAEQGGYACRCFKYEFEETQMTWTEFVPEGQPMPPEPSEEQQMMGALPLGSPYVIQLEAYSGISSTYRYATLPFGLFDSNGYSSEHVFQLRDRTKFTATGCNEICGLAVDAPPAE